MKLLYIPGFNSNGTDNYFTKNYNAEIINYDPLDPKFLQKTINKINTIVNKFPDTKLIGNSLGGWIATKASIALDIPAFLINPLVNPETMMSLIGPQTNFDTNKSYEFTNEHVTNMKKNDEDFNNTIIEKNLLFAAIGINDELINSEEFNLRYKINTSNILYLNCGHRLTEGGKNDISKSEQFKRFIDM